MVRFRGKNYIAKPTLISENFEAEFQSKLESTSQNKEIKTPKRKERASPAKTNSVKTPKLKQSASPEKSNSAKTPSRKLPKPDISGGSPPKTGSIKTPLRKSLESDVSGDSLHATRPQAIHLPISKVKSFIRKDDAYSIAGIENDLLDDQLWDQYSIDDDLMLNTVTAGKDSDEFIPIKEEGGRVFPADDPFGFLQVEREVEETARTNPPKTTPTEPKKSSETPLKSKVSTTPIKTEISASPESRRSTRLLKKASAISQNKGKGASPSKKISVKVDKHEGKLKVPKSKNIKKLRAPKKTLAETEKIIEDERARILEKFKLVDNFHLDEEFV